MAVEKEFREKILKSEQALLELRHEWDILRAESEAVVAKKERQIADLKAETLELKRELEQTRVFTSLLPLDITFTRKSKDLLFFQHDM